MVLLRVLVGKAEVLVVDVEVVESLRVTVAVFRSVRLRFLPVVEFPMVVAALSGSVCFRLLLVVELPLVAVAVVDLPLVVVVVACRCFWLLLVVEPPFVTVAVVDLPLVAVTVVCLRFCSLLVVELPVVVVTVSGFVYLRLLLVVELPLTPVVVVELPLVAVNVACLCTRLLLAVELPFVTVAVVELPLVAVAVVRSCLCLSSVFRCFGLCSLPVTGSFGFCLFFVSFCSRRVCFVGAGARLPRGGPCFSGGCGVLVAYRLRWALAKALYRAVCSLTVRRTLHRSHSLRSRISKISMITLKGMGSSFSSARSSLMEIK